MLLLPTLLLTAYSFPVTAGPVPGRMGRRYFSSFSTPSHITSTPSSLISNVSSVRSGASEEHDQAAQINTALVVQPIKVSVFTQIVPGATFVDPNGKPLLTDGPQTVVSTSFASPTPLPQTGDSSSATISQSPVFVKPLTSSHTSILSATDRKLTASKTDHPSLTLSYLPEKKSSSFLTLTTTATASSAPLSPLGSRHGFTYFHFTSQIGQTVSAPSSRSYYDTVSSVISLQSSYTASLASVPRCHTSDIAESANSASNIVTGYTPAYTTTVTIETTVLLPMSSFLTLARTTLPVTASAILSDPAGSEKSIASYLSSAPPALPTTPLPLPSMVILTLYTTTTTEIRSSSVYEPSPLSAHASVAPYMTTSATALSCFSPSAMPISSPNLFSSLPPPAPTNVPPVPLPAPPPSDSERPLIITPIPPNQIFTVTTTEKETIRETTTVMVTAQA